MSDYQYAAGLFDGEGTVTLTRRSANKKRGPAVTLSSTTYELVEFMKKMFGGQIVTLSRSKDAGHKQAWHWQSAYNQALDMLRLVEPYLLEPEKKRRANLLLTRYKEVTPRNGKYTPELLTARESFEQEFFNQSTSSSIISRT